MNAAVQKINGSISFVTAIEAEDNAYIDFAARYAGEPLNCIDEMTNASVGEFLNLQNGLFTVNVSNDSSTELTLTPPEHIAEDKLTFRIDTVHIPLLYSFGEIHFFIELLKSPDA